DDTARKRVGMDGPRGRRRGPRRRGRARLAGIPGRPTLERPEVLRRDVAADPVSGGGTLQRGRRSPAAVRRAARRRSAVGHVVAARRSWQRWRLLRRVDWLSRASERARSRRLRRISGGRRHAVLPERLRPWRAAQRQRRRAGGAESRMTGSVESRPEPRSRPPIVRTEQLFGSRREIIIKHGQEEYRLRITRADKLILTKERSNQPEDAGP